MKRTYRIILMLCVVACSGFIWSCDDENEGSSGEVTLLSFGPAGVHHGEQIRFIGENLNKVTSIVIPPGIEITSDQFVSQSKELIELVIPAAAEAGKLTLNTTDGTIETKTELSFDVDVAITAITAEAKPGTNITITGDHVNWIEEVIFKDGLSVTEFVSKSLNELVVAVPMEAQTGYLTFNTGGTDPLSFSSEAELIVSLPNVSAINPAAARHNENITLTGTNLDLVKSIVFGANKTVTTFVSQSETQIVVKVPEGAEKGKLTLKQTSPVDVQTAEFTIVLPAATSLTPQPARPGVDNITITGTNLDLVAKLMLGGTAGAIEVPSSQFTTHTATQIVLALPATATNGPVKYTTIHNYTNNIGVNVQIPGVIPALAITLYDEAIHFSGGNWSWGNTTVTLSTEQSYAGTKSWKHTNTGSDGGASVGGMTAVDASGKTVFKFSLYGGPGTNNMKVAAILNDAWGNYNTVTMKEGVWTEFSIPLTSYPAVDKTAIVRWAFKMETGTAGQYFFVDRVGFD